MAGFEPASSPAPKAGGVTGLPNISFYFLAVLTGLEPATIPQTTGYPTIGRQDHFENSFTLFPKEYFSLQCYFVRSRRESNPLFRLPTRHRDRVVHQPLCAETIFAVLTGFEPAPHTVTGWYCNQFNHGTVFENSFTLFSKEFFHLTKLL